MSKFTSSLCLAVAALSFAAASARADDKTLTIWINGDKAYNGLAKVGEKFTKDTGVKVVVEHPDDAPGKFQTAASAKSGPDVIVWAHDRAGEWVTAGLIEPVNPKPKFVGQFDKVGWDAFTIDGKVWGYPLSIEAVGLIYNKALVPKPPASFEEILPLDKKLAANGKHAILWDYTNTYFTFPLLAANGGYPFARTAKGDYNAKDIGVNNAGAIQGAEMLAKLIEAGVMPKGADYAAMTAAMSKGAVAMMISGAWEWENMRKNKIDFGVAPIPSIGGKPAKSFIGVQGAMINRASKNKQIAVEFLENYLLTMDGLKTLDSDVSLGVTAHKDFYKTRASDPLIAATMQNIRTGLIMPVNPEMGKFWSSMKSALENITLGRQKPKEGLDAAAQRIK
ncbi:MAG TPA: maltose/maltodextrin ABC transporter substrate-binding protein MalE [Kofleriaceae bacterium]|jgi:maltose/maltodextrin transport system substrate-binding protein|nr:maltose/maltodextrin ABC transporter substrate-binding protein MalE [Kofleriaceae bacterium]